MFTPTGCMYLCLGITVTILQVAFPCIFAGGMYYHY
jgi:hypothetical protein